MTIRSKMTLLVVLVLAITILVGAGVWMAVSAEDEAAEDADHLMMVAAAANETESAMLRYMGSIGQVIGEIREGEADDAAEELEEAEEYDVLVDEHLTKVSELLDEEHVSDDMRALVQQIEEEWNRVDDLAEQSVMAEAEEAGLKVLAGEEDMTAPEADAEELEELLEEAETTVEEDFTSLQEEIATLVAEVGDAAEAADQRLNAIIAGGLASIVLVTLVIGVGLVTSVTRELRRAESFASAVAGGKLDAEFGEHPTDEVGVMTQAIESMRDELLRRVENLREMAGVVMVTASDVKAATNSTRTSLDALEAEDAALEKAKESADAALASAESLDDLSKQMLDL